MYKRQLIFREPAVEGIAAPVSCVAAMVGTTLTLYWLKSSSALKLKTCLLYTSIRASERRIWQQITDIFAECSIDYDKDAEITKWFYAMVQNKFHYAITGQTAAEIVHSRADRTKEHMGLTTVSYTHLDVYKRQPVTPTQEGLSDLRRLLRV